MPLKLDVRMVRIHSIFMPILAGMAQKHFQIPENRQKVFSNGKNCGIVSSGKLFAGRAGG